MHEKRVYRVNEERGKLKCERCGRGFDAKGQRVSHVRSCTGGAYRGEMLVGLREGGMLGVGLGGEAG